jgi:hypothetical protein
MASDTKAHIPLTVSESILNIAGLKHLSITIDISAKKSLILVSHNNINN